LEVIGNRVIAYFTIFLATGAIAGPGPDLPAVEAQIARQTNEFRVANGIAKVDPDAALQRAARYFADYMARTDRYGHTADGAEPSERAKARGYDYCHIAENIAYSYSSAPVSTEELARQAVEGWKQSPGHRRNMLLPAVTDIGIAVARSPRSGRYYSVQMFGRPLSRALEFRVTNGTRRVVEYRVGSKAWSLGAGEGRIHTVCAPEEVSFPAAGNGKGRTIRPSGGENLVVAGDARQAIRVER
jgi:uncharacterized protein YkwD